MKKNEKGMGSIYFHKSKQCYAGQYVKDGIKKTIYQHKGENDREFKVRLNKLICQINDGTYIEKNKDTLESIISDYIEQRYKDGYTSSRSYRRNLDSFNQLKSTCKSFINKPIQKVTAYDINNCKTNLRKYANSTIQKQWILLRKGFEIALNRRKIQYNIMNDETIQKPLSIKEKKIIHAISKEEETKLRKALKLHYDDINAKILLIQLNTGMRIGEVLSRNINDLEGPNKELLKIHNTLTQDEKYNIILGEHTKIYDKLNNIDRGARTIVLDAETIQIFKDLSADIIPFNGYYFYNINTKRFIGPYQVGAYLNRLNKKYKICNESLGTHRLRHTYITRLQEKGVNLAVIQYLVGHVEGSNVTTEIYTDISTDFIKSELKKEAL